MPEGHKKEIKPDIEKSVKQKKPVKPQIEEMEDEFDFGGLPTEVSFTRNIGCGG
ncbi:MAG: hypothetical protein HEP71_18935 [Roseivirga sp.]|nr:hypothetical protein [Roseivirga sp.]